jgi:hypothetical protein
MAGVKFAKQLKEPFPQSVPKYKRDKGVKWAEFSSDLRDKRERARAFLDKHGILPSEALGLGVTLDP